MAVRGTTSEGAGCPLCGETQRAKHSAIERAAPTISSAEKSKLHTRGALQDGVFRRPPRGRAEGQKTGEQGVNDPVVCSLRSPDLPVVGSFTPCVSVSVSARAASQASRRKRFQNCCRGRTSSQRRMRPSRGRLSRWPRHRTRLSASLRPRVSSRLARATSPSRRCARGLDDATAERRPRQVRNGRDLHTHPKEPAGQSTVAGLLSLDPSASESAGINITIVVIFMLVSDDR